MGKSKNWKAAKSSKGKVIAVLIFLIVILASSYYFAKHRINGRGSSTTVLFRNGTTINGISYTFGASKVYYPGQSASNFLIQSIANNTVAGLSYVWYPLEKGNGTPTRLHIWDTVGYNCDGSLKMLTAIDSNSVTFTNVSAGSRYGGCPICLSGSTYIDTPDGPVTIKDMQVGMHVWTADKNGSRIIGTILKTSKTYVASNHIMVHAVLNDGREVYASPAHPTPDGRSFGNLSVGSYLDNSEIVSLQLVQYNESYTYDILPSGTSGFYYADRILVGSTLK